MLSKLRIGSFFTSRAIKCECPSASQPAATLIPVPVVERIHHHYDKAGYSRDALNRLRAARTDLNAKGYDGKILTDLKNLIDSKAFDPKYPYEYPYDSKYSYDLKYDPKYDARNVRNLYGYKPETGLKALNSAESASDSARFGELSDLISENGQRSIMSAVRAPSFGNQQSASLQEALFGHPLRDQLDPLKEQLLAEQLRSISSAKNQATNKDEPTDSSSWLDDNLNALNNPDKQSLADLEGNPFECFNSVSLTAFFLFYSFLKLTKHFRA